MAGSLEEHETGTIKLETTPQVILLNIAPILPKKFLPWAISIALNLEYPDSQFRSQVISALASRLTSEDEDLLEQTLQSARAAKEKTGETIDSTLLHILSPILPKRLIPQALELALQMPDISARIHVQMDLEERLSATEREAKARDAIGIAKTIGTDSERANVLKILVPHIPRELAEDVFNIVKDISDFDLKTQVLTLLAVSLPVKHRTKYLTEALSAVKSVSDPRRQARLLVGLAPILPHTQSKKALRIADTIQDPETRISTIAVLARNLPAAEKSSKLREILTQAKAIKDNEDIHIQILSELAPQLPKKERQDILDNIQHRTQRMNRKEKTQQRLYHVELTGNRWSSWKNAEGRTAGLAKLASRLPEEERGPLLAEARQAASLSQKVWSGSGVPGELSSSISDSLVKLTEHAGQMAISARGPHLTSSLGSIPGVEELFLQQEVPLRHILEKMPGQPPYPAETEAKPPSSVILDAQASILPSVKTPQKRVVNTGFAYREQPDPPIKPNTTLVCGKPYYFWLDVGNIDEHSIERTITTLPDYLPKDAILKVALFHLKDGIEIVSGADIGELKLLANGTAEVIKQPMQQPETTLPSDKLRTRLFFPVTIPAGPGNYKLRCNIYFEQVLIQSRLIHVHATEQQQIRKNALQATLDYTLSHTLSPSHLNCLDHHQLSLMINTNGGITHIFCFGDDDVKTEAFIQTSAYDKKKENFRNALRKISWDTTDEWTKDKVYRYSDDIRDVERLKKDLISLAVKGYDLYAAIIKKFRGNLTAKALLEKMIIPNNLQISLKETATNFLPAAFIYDYPLDPQTEHFILCETFAKSLNSQEPLDQSDCFMGKCPSKGKLDHVCPSGFWGFRHFLGMPVSLSSNIGENGLTDIPCTISIDKDKKVEMVAGVATNDLSQEANHLQKLQAFRDKFHLDFEYSDRFVEIVKLLRSEEVDIVYFYCHGGSDGDEPFLQFGDGKKKGDLLYASSLMAYEIDWNESKSHPLIFINGCHTAALKSDQVYSLVQSFIEHGGAGVIGTEITVLESLACAFAERCLDLFLTGKFTIGQAVRNTRLELLKKGNPLGLIYTPFVISSLKLKYLTD